MKNFEKEFFDKFVKGYGDGKTDWTYPEENNVLQFIKQTITEVLDDERKFVLNILDGIDIADKKTNNVGGGTKAIRFALKNRIN